MLNKILGCFFIIFSCLEHDEFISAINHLTLATARNGLRKTIMKKNSQEEFRFTEDMPNIMENDKFTLKMNEKKWVFIAFMNLFLIIAVLYNIMHPQMTCNINGETKQYVAATVLRRAVPSKIQTPKETVNPKSVVSKTGKKHRKTLIDILRETEDNKYYANYFTLEYNFFYKKYKNELDKAFRNETEEDIYGRFRLVDFYGEEIKSLRRLIEEFNNDYKKAKNKLQKAKKNRNVLLRLTGAENNPFTKQKENSSTATISRSAAEANKTSTKTERKSSTTTPNATSAI